MAIYAATVVKTERPHRLGIGMGLLRGTIDLTNYNQTAIQITDITNQFKGNDPTVILDSLSDNGFLCRWNHTDKAVHAFYPTAEQAAIESTGVVKDSDTAATIGHPLYYVPDTAAEVLTVANESTPSGLIKDDDTADGTGLAVYVVIDDVEFLPGFQLGHLEFVSPTNVDGTGTCFSGGPTYGIKDDDAAASNGVAIRIIASDGGLEATLAGSVGPVLIPMSDGQYMSIADTTTGSTPAVFFDENASNTYERLMAVVVDNGDDDYFLAEVTAITSRGAPGSRTGKFFTTAPEQATSEQGTVGSGGPEFDVYYDQAAAQMIGATLLYVKPAAAGFNAAILGGEDALVPCANGEFIPIAYASSPAGVLVYWDNDQANSYEKMVGVIVDNTNEAWTNSTTISMRVLDVSAGAALEVANDVDVGVVNFLAIARI